MTLQEIIADIHALSEDLEAYERKYGVLSETLAGIIERTARHDTHIPYFRVMHVLHAGSPSCPRNC